MAHAGTVSGNVTAGEAVSLIMTSFLVPTNIREHHAVEAFDCGHGALIHYGIKEGRIHTYVLLALCFSCGIDSCPELPEKRLNTYLLCNAFRALGSPIAS
jgi:hypothetical protein